MHCKLCACSLVALEENDQKLQEPHKIKVRKGGLVGARLGCGLLPDRPFFSPFREKNADLALSYSSAVHAWWLVLVVSC